MMYGINNMGEWLEYSSIDQLIDEVLSRGIDPNTALFIDKRATGETVFEYMVE